MYQNNYTNIPEQYLELLRNGPNENTVIRGQGRSASCLAIFLEPNVKIGTNIEGPRTIWVFDNGELVVPPTEITQDFGYKWINAFNKVYKAYNFQAE